MSIDKYLGRKYDPDLYNCAHFVCEVWDEFTGEPMRDRLESFLLPRSARHATYPLRRAFKRQDGPVSPCLALMRATGAAPHVGIFKNGRILHIDRNGVKFEPLELAMLPFKRIGFYK
jgi:hypothetical protein